MALFYLLALLFVLLDRLTKILAIRYLRDLNDSIVIVPDWLKLTYAENLGIAFGVKFLPPGGLLLLTFAISAGVVWFVWKSNNRNPLFITAFALILGGGAGNLIDRMMLGHVVDFIHFDLYQGVIFGRYMSLWPIFNVADSCITVGACLLILFHERVFGTK
ncbi:MAG: signal peptidase II [Chlorobiaceae bacterium]|nr:signal peptidase II [Chlorobiaceae bacterium]